MSPGPRAAHGEALEALATLLDLVAETMPERMSFLCQLLSGSAHHAPLYAWLEAQLRLQALPPQQPCRYQQTLSNLEILERLVADPSLHPARLTLCRDMTPLLKLASAHLARTRHAGHRKRLEAVQSKLRDLQELLQRAARRRTHGWQGEEDPVM